MFLGFHTTFLLQHWLGSEGLQRRYADYLHNEGFTAINTIYTVGSFVLGASILFFIYNVWKSWRFGATVPVDDPWGFGNSLEWATTCPPPLRNFDRMPRIRSERPAFDAKYGPLVADLGRDLPQRSARPPQHFLEEFHAEHRAPEGPCVEGAHGAKEAVAYHPAPESGARPVTVPEPEQLRRPSFEHSDIPGEDGNPFDSERGEPTADRWRRPHLREEDGED
jgi:cytochrome c oxidase subunit 1